MAEARAERADALAGASLEVTGTGAREMQCRPFVAVVAASSQFFVGGCHPGMASEAWTRKEPAPPRADLGPCSPVAAQLPFPCSRGVALALAPYSREASLALVPLSLEYPLSWKTLLRPGHLTSLE